LLLKKEITMVLKESRNVKNVLTHCPCTCRSMVSFEESVTEYFDANGVLVEKKYREAVLSLLKQFESKNKKKSK
jgi:hypothetical protein